MNNKKNNDDDDDDDDDEINGKNKGYEKLYLSLTCLRKVPDNSNIYSLLKRISKDFL